MCPYTALNIDKSADAESIKAAYRKLILEWHPDKCTHSTHEEACNRFNEIKEAYHILGDEEKRARYDAEQARKRAASRNHSSRPHFFRNDPFQPYRHSSSSSSSRGTPKGPFSSVFDEIFGRFGETIFQDAMDSTPFRSLFTPQQPSVKKRSTTNISISRPSSPGSKSSIHNRRGPKDWTNSDISVVFGFPETSKQKASSKKSKSGNSSRGLSTFSGFGSDSRPVLSREETVQDGYHIIREKVLDPDGGVTFRTRSVRV